MTSFDYSPQVVDHFLHPRHLGLLSESGIDSASEKLILTDAGYITRGDALRLSLKIRVADEKILDAGFQNLGTGLPIASASYFCSVIIGKTLSEALKFNVGDLDRELGGLPELKSRQPVLILDAFDAAVRKFRGLPQRERASVGEPSICTCFQISEGVIERAIRLRGLKTVAEITAATRAGDGCHTCHPDLEAILARCRNRAYKFHIPVDDYEAAHRLFGTPLPTAEELSANPAAAIPARKARVAEDGFVYPDKSPVAEVVANRTKARRAAPSRPWNEMSYVERLQRIEEVIEYDLRPAIRTDGGDIKLLDLKDNKVFVSLHGHCKSCHSALSTLKMGVEKRLQEAIWPELEVEEVFNQLKPMLKIIHDQIPVTNS